MYVITDVCGMYDLVEINYPKMDAILKRLECVGGNQRQIFFDYLVDKPTIVIKDKPYDIFRMFSEMRTVQGKDERELIREFERVSETGIIFLSKVQWHDKGYHSDKPGYYRATYYHEQDLINPVFAESTMRKIRIDGVLEGLKTA